jgi:hypothetical protein
VAQCGHNHRVGSCANHNSTRFSSIFSSTRAMCQGDVIPSIVSNSFVSALPPGAVLSAGHVDFNPPSSRSFVFVESDGRVIGRAPANNVENANGNLADPVVGRLLTMWLTDVKAVVDQLQRLNEAPSGMFAGRFDFVRLGAEGMRSAERRRFSSVMTIYAVARQLISTGFHSVVL